jgi:hypothetical protein
MSVDFEIEIDDADFQRYMQTTGLKLADIERFLDYELRTAMFNSEADSKAIAPVGKSPRSVDPLPHGKLRRSIHVEPRGDLSYSLIADARNVRMRGYAKYVDQGTVKMPAREFMGISVRANLPLFIEKVRGILGDAFRKE